MIRKLKYLTRITMLSSVKDYAESMKTRVSETYVSYTSKDAIEQLLIEATSNDATQLSN